MDTIKDFFTSTLFKRFFWNTLAGLLTIGAVFVSGLDWIYAPILFALFNGLSKEINTYLSTNYAK